MVDIDLDLALVTARRAVEAGARAALARFDRGIRVEIKPDRTPVTAADRDSESAILEVLRGTFPEHAILGEESGFHAAVAKATPGAQRQRTSAEPPPPGEGSPEPVTRWIVDPIDGTRGFTRGESFWGPLVALEHQGEVVVGAMALPVPEEVYFAARGRGAWLCTHGGAPKRLDVSRIAEWSDATLSLGEPGILLAPPLADRIGELATTCARTRCYGDLAGFAMVLAGRAEAWIEAGVQVWDLAPMKVLVEEAGGKFTDLLGRPAITSGNCVASNARLHAHVLAALRATPAPRDSHP